MTVPVSTSVTFDSQRLDHAFGLLRDVPMPAVAAAVVTREGILRDDSRGVANLQTGESLTSQHAFDLASLTKVLVTLPEVLSLIERGAVSLNDTVERHLPDAGWMAGENGLAPVRIG